MRIAEKVARFDTARKVMAAGIYPYFRSIESDQDTMVQINGKDVLMLGSNNYLGLTNHPQVKEAAIAALRQYGSGCAGSRFLNGTLRIHIECEERLADYMQKEAVLLFSTGFQANLGVISSLVGRNGYVVTDSLDHASIIDGARLSFGKMVKFRHNDKDDLDRVLKGLDNRSKLVITEGVFSMEGDIVKLPEILEDFSATRRGCDARRRSRDRCVGPRRSRHGRAFRFAGQGRSHRRYVLKVACVHRRVRRRDGGHYPFPEASQPRFDLFRQPAAGLRRRRHRRAQNHSRRTRAP